MDLQTVDILVLPAYASTSFSLKSSSLSRYVRICFHLAGWSGNIIDDLVYCPINCKDRDLELTTKAAATIDHVHFPFPFWTITAGKKSAVKFPLLTTQKDVELTESCALQKVVHRT